MYVCMYVCMYIYVFMYVCMYVCMCVCVYVCIYVCMYVFVYVCVYACMYLSMCVWQNPSRILLRWFSFWIGCNSEIDQQSSWKIPDDIKQDILELKHFNTFFSVLLNEL